METDDKLLMFPEAGVDKKTPVNGGQWSY